MQSRTSWLLTGIVLFMAMFAALVLIGLARLAPNVIRWLAQSALAVAAVHWAIKRAANACYASID